MKTELSVPGYFKRPEATAALFDEDGYLRTGDIMEERGPDHLVYIDRRNDVLKLAQGEFVAVGGAGHDVRERQRRHPPDLRLRELGPRVPARRRRPEHGGRRDASSGTDPSTRPSSGLDPRRAEAGRRGGEPQVVRGAARLHRRDGAVQPRERSALERPQAHAAEPAAQVRRALEQLYADLETQAERRADGAAATRQRPERAREGRQGARGHARRRGSRRHAAEQLRRARRRLARGGRVLGAAADIFGVDVPVNAILSPAGNPQQWARAIEAALDDSQSAPTFARIHGKGARQLSAKDLDIVDFIDAQGPRRIRRWASHRPSPGPCC